MTWKDGFSEWSDSYRWRDRKEKERTERMTQIEHALAALQAQVNAQQSHQATGPSQQHEEPALEAVGCPDSARSRSVASTENVQPTLEMAGPRCPVDEIPERDHAELHL